MLEIIQNMMVSQGLELELSMFRTKKDYNIRSTSLGLGTGPKFVEISIQPLQLYFNGNWETSISNLHGFLNWLSESDSESGDNTSSRL